MSTEKPSTEALASSARVNLRWLMKGAKEGKATTHDLCFENGQVIMSIKTRSPRSIEEVKALISMHKED